MANGELRIVGSAMVSGECENARLSATRYSLLTIRHFSRGFRQRGLGLREGPVDPRRQRLEIGSLDGRAAPDAQARRRIAMRRDVVGGAFLLDARDEILHEGPLRVDRERR